MFKIERGWCRWHLVAAATVVAAVGLGSARASFVASNVGPLNSAGPVGDAGNSIFTSTYAGANDLFGRLTFAGDLWSGGTGSYQSEARFKITNQTTAGSAFLQPSTLGSTWTGSVPVSVTANALVWANSGDTFQFESWESYDDPGLDAWWTDVSFTFDNSVSVTSLGSFASGSSFLFDTEGSTGMSDTELAGYQTNGTFLSTDDDSGTGYLSSLNLGVLPIGDYYLVMGGYNSSFGTGFAFPGTDLGDYNINLNSVSVATGTLASGEFRVLSFSVVPEPTSVSLLVLGGLALLRRRR